MVNQKSIDALKANSPKPGEVRNPNGRPKGLISQLMGVAPVSKAEVHAFLLQAAKMTYEELQDLDANVDASILERTIARALWKAYQDDGNLKAFDWLFNRVYGQAKQEVELNANVNIKVQQITLPGGTVIEI